MTINQGLQNRAINTPDHFVIFRIPLGTPFKEYLDKAVEILSAEVMARSGEIRGKKYGAPYPLELKMDE